LNVGVLVPVGIEAARFVELVEARLPHVRLARRARFPAQRCGMSAG
jgi:hypothetical protein